MKKFFCIFLSLIMIGGLCLPAFATQESYPIITLRGDGEPIYNADGECVSDIFGNVGDVDKDGLVDSIASVCRPLFYQGVLLNNWQPYYDAFAQEIAPLFEDMALDENGESESTISQNAINANLYDMQRNDGNLNYEFRYDWRLDPWEIAEELNTYINAVLASTGCKKVCLVARCLGSSFVMAYLTRYGYDKVKGLGLDAPVCFGSELFTEMTTGKMDLDGYAINRFLLDLQAFEGQIIDDFLMSSLELFNESGVTNLAFTVFKNTLYEKLKKGLTGKLMLVSVGSYLSYWSMVYADKYEDAKAFIFGDSDSDTYKQYAKFIEKLDRYHYRVKVNQKTLLQDMSRDGIEIGIVAKYGSQNVPLSESANTIIGDKDIGLSSSSIGATTAATLYDTLDESYIQKQIDAGKGEYISPDKQVDASTCLFPDYTWIVKGIEHANWTATECRLLEKIVTAETQLTIKTAGLPQYLVPTPENNSILVPMTAENCNVGNWTAEKDKTVFDSISSYFNALKIWITLLFQKMTSLLGIGE